MYYPNAHAFVKQHLIGYKPKKIATVYPVIYFQIVWRHWLCQISLDDMRLYVACNAPIQDKTAEVH